MIMDKESDIVIGVRYQISSNRTGILWWVYITDLSLCAYFYVVYCLKIGSKFNFQV